MPVIGNISNGTAQCSYLCKSVTTRSLNSTPLYRKCTLSFSLLQMRWKISLSLRVLICFRGICRYFSIHALGRQVCYSVFFSYCGTLDHSHALFNVDRANPFLCLKILQQETTLCCPPTIVLLSPQNLLRLSSED